MKRPIVHPRTPGQQALYATLHQAATSSLRQSTLSGQASAQLVAERTEQARIAEQIRAARRAQEAADMRSFAES